MKIVHLTFSFETGGLQTMLIDILNEQCQSHEVSLVIVNDFYEPALLEQIDERVRVFRLDRKPGSRNPIQLLKLNGLLFRLNPAVVHCHNNELVALLIPHKFTTCLTVHDVNYPDRYFRKYDKVFAISDAVAADLRERAGIRPEIVYNGIYADQLQYRLQPSQPDTFHDTFHIVQIGRLVHTKKGQHLALQALHELVYSRNLRHVRLSFIGEGESLAYLEALTLELGLKPYVTFVGLRGRDFVYEHLKDYDLLIQPSLFEGFGLTVAEAMAAGVPVLVSAIEGPLEIIDNGLYGWAFPVGDAEALANQIETIIKTYHTPSFQQKIEQARSRAQSAFNVRETARQYILAY